MSPDDVEARIQRLTEELSAGPPDRDRVRAQLAIAYSQRVRGSRDENLRRILVHTDSLELSDEDADLWAATRVLRGQAFRDRGRTERLGQSDLGVALAFFNEALAHYAEGSVLWADVHTEIGRTLLRTPDWPEAEEHLRLAREAYRRAGRRDSLAAVYELLGAFYLGPVDVPESAYLRRAALEHYSLALAHADRAGDPELWARVQIAIGRLSQVGGPDVDDLVATHLREAVDVLSAEDHPVARVEALRELAAFHFHRGRWADALPYYDEALTLALDGACQAATVGGRRAAAVGMSQLAHCLAYCHYREGCLDQALVALESGRARLLLDRLAETSREIRELESADYGGMGYLEDMDRLEALRWEQGEPSAEPTVARLGPDEEGTALVVPLVCSAGSALFVVTAGDEHIAPDNVLDLPQVTTRDVDRLLDGDGSGPGWLRAHRHRADDEERWRSTVLGVCGELGRLMVGVLASRLRELDVSRVVVVPAAGLQFLPIHAAVIGPGPRRLLDEVTVEYIPSAAVRHLMRDRRRGRRLTGHALVAGASSYPALPPLPAVPDELELVGALLEATPLPDGAATREDVLSGMTNASVLHLACHGAGWAMAGNIFRYEWEPPPVLHLGEEGLSFQDILLADLRAARLVCLSACDTGLVEHTLPWDEFEGLVTVFMQAGAPAVVSTLWAVDDRSTALLMQRFYENLREHDDLAGALHRAQLWLRDSTRAELAAVYERQVALGHDRFLEPYTDLMLGGAPDDVPYAHPVHWAPFTFTGA